jgi:hypothetical protein
MKKLALIFPFALLSFTQVRAQEGYTHLNLSAGRVLNGGVNGTVALEFSKRYHNSYEIFLDVYNKTSKFSDLPSVNLETNVLVGGNYKPMLSRNKNTYLKARLGGGIGSNNIKFIAGLQAGLELGYVLPGNTVLIIQQKNDFVFWANTKFRPGVLVGIKLPLNKK